MIFWPHYTDAEVKELLVYVANRKEVLKMPHDKNGNLVKVGDVVSIEFVVTGVQQSEEYCNLSLETVLPMSPGTHKSSFNANASQASVAQGSGEDAA